MTQHAIGQEGESLWARRWVKWLDRSEVVLMFVAGLCGAQILIIGLLRGSDPVYHAISQVLPVPWLVGVLLEVNVVLHLRGIALHNPVLRRRCIFWQLVYFAFSDYSLLFVRLFTPFAAVGILFILATVVNYVTLMRPLKQETSECKAGSGR